MFYKWLVEIKNNNQQIQDIDVETRTHRKGDRIGLGLRHRPCDGTKVTQSVSCFPASFYYVGAFSSHKFSYCLYHAMSLRIEISCLIEAW